MSWVQTLAFIPMNKSKARSRAESLVGAGIGGLAAGGLWCALGCAGFVFLPAGLSIVYYGAPLAGLALIVVGVSVILTRRNLQASPEPARRQIACSLSLPEQATRLLELKETFRRYNLGSCRLSEGRARWRFRNEPPLVKTLQDLSERERSCCPFFSFQLEMKGSEIWWEAAVPVEAAAVLDALFELLPSRRDDGMP